MFLGPACDRGTSERPPIALTPTPFDAAKTVGSLKTEMLEFR